MDPVQVDVNDLFQEGHDEGSISTEAVQSLRIADLNDAIRPGLAVNIEDVAASEMILLTLLIDDSGSIRFSSNAQAVRDGYNQIKNEVLRGSRESEEIMIHTRYLNPSIRDENGDMTDILYPFCPIEQAVDMNPQNYDPRGSTPLYDQIFVTLATVQAEMQRWTRLNVPCRSIVVIITDGADLSSSQHSPATIRPVVGTLLSQEVNVICAMGIEDGEGTNFRRVFADMGIPPEWVLTPDNTESDIRRAFGMVSRSVSTASRPATGMTSTQIRGSFEWDQ